MAGGLVVHDKAFVCKYCGHFARTRRLEPLGFLDENCCRTYRTPGPRGGQPGPYKGLIRTLYIRALYTGFKGFIGAF